jgi:ATP-binding cassette subfamily F protein uup
MALVTIDQLHMGFRGPALLDDVSLRIEPGQRIGLLGRNGAGKTTLMRILTGEVQPDHGHIAWQPGARGALLPQDVPRDLKGLVRAIITSGVVGAETGHSADHAPDHDMAGGDWQAEHAVKQIISRMQLEHVADTPFETLSSGMKRRVLLARTIVSQPALLLLDEPTNHLDIGAIQWLEEFLLRWSGTLMFVTHDRSFLRKVATRILEIDRGRVFDWACDYDKFLERKEAALAAEAKQDELFDKKLAIEETWIRQGIKARRTRNEGRVRALESMRRERAKRRTQVGAAQMVIQEGQRSGQLVVLTDKVSFAYEGRPIVQDFSTMIMRGDKVGIIGSNGAGKTTLLRILLGKLAPQQGSVRLGTNLQIAYFDQLREQLREDATVQDNVGDGYDSITINGRSRHIIGYLQDFLFSAERARTQVRFLSGGERNRVLLAKLFAKPANVIVLDEPTNDLDTETLELLEQLLVDFQGTVLLVSHDRSFLNNVVGSTIVFDEGNVREFVGGYDDWLAQKANQSRGASDKNSSGERTGPKNGVSGDSGTSTSEAETVAAASNKRRLKFKEQQELTNLPARIEKMEAAIAAIHEQMADPGFYQQGPNTIADTTNRLQELQSQLASSYARWEELEAAAGG